MFRNRIKIRSNLIITILIVTTLVVGGCQTATQDTTERSVIEVEEAPPVVPEPTEAPPPTPTSPPPTATEEPSPTPIPNTDTPEPTPTNAVTIIEGELTIYTEEDGLFSNDIFQVYADSKGGLWMVSGVQENWVPIDISYYDGETWTSYNDNLPSAWAYTITEAPDGSIWTALPGSGGKVAQYDGEIWTVYQLVYEGNFTTIDIAVGADQLVWVLDLDSGWLSCYEEGEWVNFDTRFSSGSESWYRNCWSINLGTDGSIWGACDGYLLHFQKEPESVEFMQPEMLGNINPEAFAVDPNGWLWVGSSEGFSTYDGTNWTNYNTEDGLLGTRVLSIVITDDGVAYLGTNVGVSVFDSENWFVIEVPKEYIGIGIDTISVALDGSLWFGSSRGLFHFVPEG